MIDQTDKIDKTNQRNTMDMPEAKLLSDEMMCAVSGGAAEAGEETVKKGTLIYFYYYKGTERAEDYARVTNITDYHGRRNQPWYYITADATTRDPSSLPKQIQHSQVISFTNPA